ncbi:hypothetical protein [Epilithonimonas sp.]|uniref:hypothetical protein n=1 Tax=Epilithonimonas sp. TaxID=2894511 RepID=UPI00289ADF89|nr:hypothetical protein [Epilithonimonas sp.]
MFFYAVYAFLPNKKDIYFNEYQNLSEEERRGVVLYREKVEKAFPKKNTEVSLMLNYKCFLNQMVTINDTMKKDFPKLKNENEYGTIFVNVKKNFKKNIKFETSDGLKIKILPKEKYDYISVCYNKNFKEWYVEYYDYPYLNFNE